MPPYDPEDPSSVQFALDQTEMFLNSQSSAIEGRVDDLEASVTALQAARGVFNVHKGGTDQTAIVTATFTKVSWSAGDNDDGWFDFTNERFLPLQAGWYRLSGRAAYTTSLPDGTRTISVIYKNGSEHKRIHDLYQGVAGGGSAANGSVIVEANGSTDYFELFTWHNRGSNADLEGDANITYFQGHYLGT